MNSTPGAPVSVSLLMVLLGWTAATVFAKSSSSSETLLERAYALDSGKTMPRDAAAAAALYQQAAGEGDGFAHLRLGYLYETGDGVVQEYSLARMHYQAAADLGMGEAHLRLAICNLEGWGGPADRAAFVREMQIAAEAKVGAAERILSTMYFIGFAVPLNRDEGLKYLELAASQDDADAEYRLGRENENRKRLALMPDPELARTWYQLSAEKDYHIAMRAMARTFLNGSPANRNWQLGRRWLELASQGGDSEAPYTLAVCELLDVDAPNRDEAQVRSWLKLASGRGNERATEVLQLEAGGQSLAEAVKYVIRVPFEERYVEERQVPQTSAPTRKPVVRRLVKPVYPLSLRLTETEGKVIVDFVVDTKGMVRNAKAIESSHPLFADRAVEAVRQWRFVPGRVKGRNVNTHLRVPIVFQLIEEQIMGVDGLLNSVRDRAATLGADVEADVTDLGLARPATELKTPTLPDGAPLPANARVVLLLVIDANGRPIRAHTILAAPAEAAKPVTDAALAGIFIPRVIDDKPTGANVVLVYSTPNSSSAVFRK